MKTQQVRILGFSKLNRWTCQRRFWDNHIFSPHTRRREIEMEGQYRFEERPCEHGIRGSKDFKRVRVAA